MFDSPANQCVIPPYGQVFYYPTEAFYASALLCDFFFVAFFPFSVFSLSKWSENCILALRCVLVDHWTRTLYKITLTLSVSIESCCTLHCLSLLLLCASLLFAFFTAKQVLVKGLQAKLSYLTENFRLLEIGSLVSYTESVQFNNFYTYAILRYSR